MVTLVSDRRLGVAIVGLGMAMPPHLAALEALRDQVELIWAASPGAARTDAFAALYPAYRTTNDIASVIADPRVDAVILLTPPNTHASLGLEIMARGKHLLVEKPLDARIDNAEALVKAARVADVRLGVVLQHRFRPAAKRLLEIARDKGLGEVQAATMSVPWWRPQSYYDEPGRGTVARDGGGVLLTQAIHTLDLFRVLAGPMKVRSAITRRTSLHRIETEDVASALFVLDNGGVASMFATTAAYPGAVETIQLIGTRGTATLAGEQLKVDWIEGGSECRGSAAPQPQGDPMDFSFQPHRDLLADFLEAVRTGRDPLASGVEALATQTLINAIFDGERRAQ